MHIRSIYSRYTYAVSCEKPWGNFDKFIKRVFAKRMGEREVKRSLKNLKSILEK